MLDWIRVRYERSTRSLRSSLAMGGLPGRATNTPVSAASMIQQRQSYSCGYTIKIVVIVLLLPHFIYNIGIVTLTGDIP